jgi:hypothetical protein
MRITNLVLHSANPLKEVLMNQCPSPLGRALPALLAATFLGLAAACEQAPLEPFSQLSPTEEATAARMGGVYTETVYLEPMMDGVIGTSTLQRRNNGFAFRVMASGLEPRHPVTLWAINLETGDVGRAAGGIVGGSGRVTLAGNHCVHEGGKSPGTPPTCDLIDPMGDIRFVLLQGEDEWTPGDMMVRWNPAGKPPAAVANHMAPE